MIDVLTAGDLEFFRANGYTTPFRVFGRADAEALGRSFETEILGEGVGLGSEAGQCRHLDQATVYDCCDARPIVSRVSQLLGPDVVLWRSHVWCKQPGEPAVAWHQDPAYWPIEPVINVTCWIALSPATVESGCLRFVPGSHGAMLETADLQGDPINDTIRDGLVDDSLAVPLEMEAGQAVLFHSLLVHDSLPNRSRRPRTGLAARYTTPSVRVDHARLLGGLHKNVMVQGEDRMGLNQLQGRPDGC